VSALETFNKVAIANVKKIPGEKIFENDAFGYTTMYLASNPGGRWFWKTDESGTVFFWCHVTTPNAKDGEGYCLDTAALPGNISAHFLFPYRLRGSIPDAERRIADLLETFEKK
jgi:hypothetical protein